MKRKYIDELLNWKKSGSKKPLMLWGARQVGKSWLMNEFATKYYKHYVKIEMNKRNDLQKIFDEISDPETLIKTIELLLNIKIDDDTLIIIDEIQLSNNALSLLKSFAENNYHYNVISAGSLLGVYLDNNVSYPVGKVDIVHVYPLDFGEFLMNTDEGMFKYYESIKNPTNIIKSFHETMIQAFCNHLLVGGLPECVQMFIDHKSLDEIINKQGILSDLYRADFIKHSGSIDAHKILEVYDSIDRQIANPHGKFKFNLLTNGRKDLFYSSIQWLIQAGLVTKLDKIVKSEQPIIGFKNIEIFKLFLFDTGILCNRLSIHYLSLLNNDEFIYKGPITENYVMQHLSLLYGNKIGFFLSDYSTEEVDFLIQHQDKIIPIEVKSGYNTKSASLKNYVSRNNPPIAIRLSRQMYSIDKKTVDIPLYLIGKIPKFIDYLLAKRK